ncbi:MAG TPA: TIGR01620 family protein [Hyphomicrobium sp.]|nr:TIGR01620 family protein [Hyphomicrobium sp.]
MTNADGYDDKPRAPRAFRVDDPALMHAHELELPGEPDVQRPHAPSRQIVARGLSRTDLTRGIRWGSIMLSAMAALATLAAGVWFTRFVTVALERQDWIGWLAFALMSLIALSAVVIALKELWGLHRLARLSRLRKSIRDVQASRDMMRERDVVRDLAHHYAARSDLKWGLARLKEHAGDVHAPGDLLRLADRELLGPIDEEARRAVLRSSKRVATVTALSPMAWIAMAYVMVENLRMFRALAGLYGGRPGVMGALRLGRLVVTHIIATGGLAMTDDLLGQFLGQDALRRLSRRLGEGAFNGALTARLGVAAIEVTRPGPFLDTEPVRVREIFSELMRSLRSGRAGGAAGEPPPR